MNVGNNVSRRLELAHWQQMLSQLSLDMLPEVVFDRHRAWNHVGYLLHSAYDS
jgi:hypothetical protein